jgi:hypothetical protein
MLKRNTVAEDILFITAGSAIVGMSIVAMGIALYALIRRFLSVPQSVKKLEACLIIPPVLVYSYISLTCEENLRLAEEHIRTAIGKALADGKQVEHIVLLFDIIVPQERITPEQALGLAHQVIDHIQAHYPGLKGRIIGVSNNVKVYTVHEVLLTGKLALGDVDNVHQFLIA